MDRELPSPLGNWTVSMQRVYGDTDTRSNRGSHEASTTE